MPSLNDQPNEIAGNRPSQPAETAKTGADAQNSTANNPLQPATPAQQAGEPAATPPPSSKELFDSEMEAGKGAVEQGGQRENREAKPADVTAQPTPDAPPLSKLAGTAPARPAPPAGSDPAGTTSSNSLANSETSVRAGAVEPGGQQENRAAAPTAGAPDAAQPNVYGGNFGNDVEGSYRDAERASNQRADANRGEFGEHGTLGATHGGFGNQYREFDTAAERPSAEATEEKYYGQGASAPGPQHNAYRTYDGQDRRPDEQGHAVRDTPAPPTMSFGDNVANRPPAIDGRGNVEDNRNLPDKAGEVAAFQNDNGAPTSGAAYAPDYGHTSGVGLPAGATENHIASGLEGRNQQEDQHSSRGGYDNQGSQGGRSHDQQPGGAAPAGQGAPAPVNSPDALQNPGYGHERNEESQPGSPNTGDSRNGFGASGSKEGSTSQGYGSKGGSYDDQNPGARGPEYDNFTHQDKAQNYGQENRPDFRPADGDQPKDADDTAPRRNAGRDEPAQ